MIIRGMEVEIDFLDELNVYDFDKVRQRGSEFLCCSPFRKERSPSFSLNIDSGLWIDYGAVDDEYRKGNFIKLLAFLRDESYQETTEYLLEKYFKKLENTDDLKLNLNINLPCENLIDIANPYAGKIYKTDYFTNRGITPRVQELFELGFDDEASAVAMPWHDALGNIINIKFRLVGDKTFFYDKQGKAIKHYVYGLHLIKRYGLKTVAICESEIDAMYLWSSGIPSIALGGSHISDNQINQILSSQLNEIIIATDNDKVGRELAKELEGIFSPHLVVSTLEFITDAKDVNECSTEVITSMYAHRKKCSPVFIKS